MGKYNYDSRFTVPHHKNIGSKTYETPRENQRYFTRHSITSHRYYHHSYNSNWNNRHPYSNWNNSQPYSNWNNTIHPHSNTSINLSEDVIENSILIDDVGTLRDFNNKSQENSVNEFNVSQIGFQASGIPCGQSSISKDVAPLETSSHNDSFPFLSVPSSRHLQLSPSSQVTTTPVTKSLNNDDNPANILVSSSQNLALNDPTNVSVAEIPLPLEERTGPMMFSHNFPIVLDLRKIKCEDPDFIPNSQPAVNFQVSLNSSKNKSIHDFHDNQNDFINNQDGIAHDKKSSAPIVETKKVTVCEKSPSSTTVDNIPSHSVIHRAVDVLLEDSHTLPPVTDFPPQIVEPEQQKRSIATKPLVESNQYPLTSTQQATVPSKPVFGDVSPIKVKQGLIETGDVSTESRHMEINNHKTFPVNATPLNKVDNKENVRKFSPVKKNATSGPTNAEDHFEIPNLMTSTAPLQLQDTNNCVVKSENVKSRKNDSVTSLVTINQQKVSTEADVSKASHQWKVSRSKNCNGEFTSSNMLEKTENQIREVKNTNSSTKVSSDGAMGCEKLQQLWSKYTDEDVRDVVDDFRALLVHNLQLIPGDGSTFVDCSLKIKHVSDRNVYDSNRYKFQVGSGFKEKYGLDISPLIQINISGEATEKNSSENISQKQKQLFEKSKNSYFETPFFDADFSVKTKRMNGTSEVKNANLKNNIQLETSVCTTNLTVKDKTICGSSVVNPPKQINNTQSEIPIAEAKFLAKTKGISNTSVGENRKFKNNAPSKTPVVKAKSSGKTKEVSGISTVEISTQKDNTQVKTPVTKEKLPVKTEAIGGTSIVVPPKQKNTTQLGTHVVQAKLFDKTKGTNGTSVVDTPKHKSNTQLETPVVKPRLPDKTKGTNGTSVVDAQKHKNNTQLATPVVKPKFFDKIKGTNGTSVVDTPKHKNNAQLATPIVKPKLPDKTKGTNGTCVVDTTKRKINARLATPVVKPKLPVKTKEVSGTSLIENPKPNKNKKKKTLVANNELTLKSRNTNANISAIENQKAKTFMNLKSQESKTTKPKTVTKVLKNSKANNSLKTVEKNIEESKETPPVSRRERRKKKKNMIIVSETLVKETTGKRPRSEPSVLPPTKKKKLANVKADTIPPVHITNTKNQQLNSLLRSNAPKQGDFKKLYNEIDRLTQRVTELQQMVVQEVPKNDASRKIELQSPLPPRKKKKSKKSK